VAGGGAAGVARNHGAAEGHSAATAVAWGFGRIGGGHRWRARRRMRVGGGVGDGDGMGSGGRRCRVVRRLPGDRMPAVRHGHGGVVRRGHCERAHRRAGRPSGLTSNTSSAISKNMCHVSTLPSEGFECTKLGTSSEVLRLCIHRSLVSSHPSQGSRPGHVANVGGRAIRHPELGSQNQWQNQGETLKSGHMIENRFQKVLRVIDGRSGETH